MVSRQISFFLVLLGAVVATESFAVVRFWRPKESMFENNAEHNHTAISDERETKQKQEKNNTVLIIVWTSICVMFLVACGLIIILNKSKVSLRRVKDLIHQNAKVDNTPCRFKTTENPLYSIKWGMPLPTIPEENADDYVAVTGYLTFHRPRPKHGHLHKSCNTNHTVDLKTQPSTV